MAKITQYITTFLMVLLLINVAPSMIRSIKEQFGDMLEPKTRVGKIRITGEINAVETHIKQLKKYFEDKSIKAILLAIESQGGASGSSQAVYQEILALKKEYPKPVVALSLNMCASGAYYIAAAADYIITTPSALVGMIGSFIGFFTVNDLITKYDVHYHVAAAGKYKTLGNPFVPTNEAVTNLLNNLSHNVYTQFTQDIATSRKLSLKKVDEWADGKILTGQQAKELGLVDELGSYYTAVAKIKELALLRKDDEIEWVETPKPTLWTKLFDQPMESSNSLKNFATALTDQLTRSAGTISSN